jgi:hypothetical protein
VSTDTRDRYVDALRVGSLVVVILGHWLMADVGPDGEVGNALVSAPALQLVTWVLQVMPLFFLVGGVAHAYALASLDRRGVAGPGRYATFVGSRATRLLRPTLALIGVWIGVSLVVRATGATGGADGPLVVTALRLVTQPLWFVGIYLGVAALAPAMLRAHRRWGAWVVVWLAAAVGVVDLLRFTAGFAQLATPPGPRWSSSRASRSGRTRSRWSACRAGRSPTWRRRRPLYWPRVWPSRRSPCCCATR